MLLITIFFSKKIAEFFFQFFLNLPSLWLNLRSICLISSQITLSGQTSRKVTHPHTTPARARLTSQFYPTPAPPHLTATCWYIYHINPIKPCWCLGLCSYWWVWWNFEKYFKLPCHITNHFLKRNSKKSSKPIFFSVTSGAPSKRCATSKFDFFWIFFKKWYVIWPGSLKYFSKFHHTHEHEQSPIH